MKRTKKTLAGIVAVSLALSMMPMSISAIGETGSATATSAVEVNYTGAKQVAFDMTDPYEGLVTTLTYQFDKVKIAKNMQNFTVQLAEPEPTSFPDLATSIKDKYNLSYTERDGIKVLYDILDVTVSVGSSKYVVTNDSSSADFDRVFADDYSNLPTTGALLQRLGELNDSKGTGAGYLDNISISNFRDALVSDDSDYYKSQTIKVEIRVAAKAIGNYANRDVILDYRDKVGAAITSGSSASLVGAGFAEDTGNSSSSSTYVDTITKAIANPPTIYKDKDKVSAWEGKIGGLSVTAASEGAAAEEFIKQLTVTEEVKGADGKTTTETKFVPKISASSVYAVTDGATTAVDPTIEVESVKDMPVSLIVNGANGSIHFDATGTDNNDSKDIRDEGCAGFVGKAVVTTDTDNKTTIDVTLLTKNSNDIIGAKHESTSTDGTKTSIRNYHIVIPINGLNTDWVFKSGYDWDDESNPTFNITTGNLMLWLPANPSNTYTRTIILKNSKTEETKTIVINTTKIVDSTTYDSSSNDSSISPDSKVPDYKDAFSGAIQATKNAILAELKSIPDIKDGEVTLKYTKGTNTVSVLDVNGNILQTFPTQSGNNSALVNAFKPYVTTATTDCSAVIKVTGLNSTTSSAKVYKLHEQKFIEEQGWKEATPSTQKIKNDKGVEVSYTTYADGTQYAKSFADIKADIAKIGENQKALQNLLTDSSAPVTSFLYSKATVPEKATQGTTALPRPQTIRANEWFGISGVYDYRNSQYYLSEIVDAIGDSRGAVVTFNVVPSSIKKNVGIVPTVSTYDAARYLSSGAQSSILLRANSTSTNALKNLVSYDVKTSTLSFNWDEITNARFTDNVLYVRTLDVLSAMTFDIDSVQVTIPDQAQFAAQNDPEKNDADIDGKEPELGEKEDNDNIVVEEPDDSGNVLDDIDLGNTDVVSDDKNEPNADDLIGDVTDGNQGNGNSNNNVVDVTPANTTNVTPVNSTPVTGNAVAGFSVTAVLASLAAIVFKRKMK